MAYGSVAGIWTQSGCSGEPDGSVSYAITDFERDLALKMLVAEVKLDKEEDERGV